MADLGLLYDRVARASHSDRNPVVLVPGILGSRLEEGETVVWGAFHGNHADPGSARGARQVALPMGRGLALAELRDDVRATGALESLEVKLFGLPVDVAAYVNLLGALGIGGYRDASLGLSGSVDYGEDHYTCFQFAYDWRRDIAESAGELERFLLEQRDYLRAEYARRGIVREPVRFDVVAHSMGGLVLRYFLRYGSAPLPGDGSLPPLTWAGAELVARAILVATPNAGSVEAFVELREGEKIGPFLPTYSATVLGTFPSVYQLLPRQRHGAFGDLAEDMLEPSTWERFGWGLADPDAEDNLAELLPAIDDPAERRLIALDHQAKCLARAGQLFRALDLPADPPAGTELLIVVGDAEKTPARVNVGPRGQELKLEYSAGDGTVLRSSALMDERLGEAFGPVLVSPIRWSRVLFFFEEHLALTRSPAFIDNLLFALLEEPRR